MTEYGLTEAGRELRDVIEHLGAWGVRWAFTEPKPDELDPALLVWRVHQRIDRRGLPPGRTVLQFDLSGRREISVCLNPRPTIPT